MDVVEITITSREWDCPKCNERNYLHDIPTDNYVKCINCGKNWEWESQQQNAELKNAFNKAIEKIHELEGFMAAYADEPLKTVAELKAHFMKEGG